MEAVRKFPSVDKKWVVADVCALFVGASIRFMLSNTATNPVLNDMGRLPVVPRLAHYLFHPLTYAAVAALFALAVIRFKFVGFWSVFFSFMVGGISATILLALR